MVSYIRYTNHMKIKPNYIVIPLVTICTAILGSYFTTPHIVWLNTELITPSWQPPNYVFGPVWTTLYILTTASALLVWNKATKKQQKERNTLMVVFGINATLNIFWSYVFFTRKDLMLAVWEAGLLALSILLLIILAKPISKVASWLLVPYLLWVSFATYLSYTIYMLNL